jgi:membrane-associated phospholipid phosphatase
MPSAPQADPPNAARLSRYTPLDFALALALVLVAIVLLVGLAVRGNPPPLDIAVGDALAAAFPTAATDLFNFTGTLPVFFSVGLAAAAICWFQGRRPMAAAFVLGLCGEVATTVIKVIVDRPRPPGASDIEAFVTAASYPSGHTVRIVVVAGLLVAAFAGRHGLARWLPIAAAIAWAILVGCARIASREHWATDVLGGWLLGAAWLSLCLAAERTLRSRRGLSG